MIEIGKLLRDSDPLANEPALAAADIERMRRAAMSHLSGPPTARWPQPVLVAVTIALTLIASIALGRRLPPPRGAAIGDDVTPSQAHDPVSPEPSRRQLQFATPGGTRIIWVFNSDFSL